MKTILICSQKGGSGKSTLCANLAVCASQEGRTAVMDTDSPQGSLSRWFNTREKDTPYFATKWDVDVDWLLVDTPPRIPQGTMVEKADLVVIPVRPSPLDVQAVDTVLEVVRACKKPYVFVINSTKPNARLTVETLRVLAGVGIVCPMTVGDRVSFAISMLQGLSVIEMEPKSRSSEEVAEVWEYVKGQANGG
jgi:chromosome partitioning protein